MTLLRAIDITTRVARDVVCDEAGRLIVVVLGANAGAMAVWGEITGTIGAQTDLQVLLANNYVALAAPGVIVVRHTFNPTVPGAPFVVGANAAGQLVAGLNADLLDSQEGTYYLDRTNHTGVILPAEIDGFEAAIDAAIAAYLAANPAFPGDVTFDGDTVIFNSDADFNNPVEINGVLTFNVPFALDPLVQGTLITGLNADLLDGQHGAYYLSRSNHTGTIPIAVVEGLQAELDALSLGDVAQLGANNTFTANNTFNGTVIFGGSVAASTEDLVVNFNADLLDGEEGSYYLNRANHTGVIAIADVDGLADALDGALLATEPTTVTSLLTFNNPDWDGISPIDVGVQFNANTRLTLNSAAVVQWGLTSLITNLNADRLDNQQGTFYLARANHTGTQLHTTVSDFDLGVYETLSLESTTDQDDVAIEYASPLYFARADKVSQKPREVWMNDTEFFSADEYGQIPANVPGIIWNETNGAFDPLNNSDFVIRKWRKAPSGFAPAAGVDFYSEIEYLETSVASNNAIEATTSAIDLNRYLISDVEAGNAYLQLLRVNIITRHMQAGLLDASNKYNVRASYATSIGSSYTNFVDYTPTVPDVREDYQKYFIGGGQVFVQSNSRVFIDFRVGNTGSPGRANHSMRLAYRWWRGA